MAKKILIIDDEAEIVGLIKTRLERSHYEVDTAYDGEEGIKRVKENRPDLIILDAVMPKVGGYTFIKLLKANEQLKNIPVIVLTGRAALYEAFQNEGVEDYLLKPFMPEELVIKVDEFFKRWEIKNQQ